MRAVCTEGESIREEFMMAVIQIMTLVVISVNLCMEIANTVVYHKRIDRLQKRVEALEAMLGSSQ